MLVAFVLQQKMNLYQTIKVNKQIHLRKIAE